MACDQKAFPEACFTAHQEAAGVLVGLQKHRAVDGLEGLTSGIQLQGRAGQAGLNSPQSRHGSGGRRSHNPHGEPITGRQQRIQLAAQAAALIGGEGWGRAQAAQSLERGH